VQHKRLSQKHVTQKMDISRVGKELMESPILSGEMQSPEQVPADKERVLFGLLSNLDGMVYRCRDDADWTMEFISDGCLRLTGYRPDELLFNGTASYAQIIHPEDHKRVRDEIRAAIKGKHRFLIEHRIICQDGTIKWVWARGACADEEDYPVVIEGFVEDVTKVRLNREKLEYLANHDPVTNLPNRLLLNDRLRRMMVNAQRSQSVVAVALVDLDNFKLINDTFGHNRGDQLLQTIAKRMQSCLRESDTVARLGGDEFVLLLSGENRGEALALAIQRVLKSVARPWQFEGHELGVSCSIGVSVFPRDGRDVQMLLRNADAAMYKAKELGKNNYQFYSPEMNTAIVQRLELQNMLQQALEKNQFVLFYQPKVDLTTGKISGMEALLRIAGDDNKLLQPQEFIKLAEETGLIVPIGEWVMRQACAFNKFLQDRNLPAMPVAINLSARQLVRYDLVGAVEQALNDTGLPAQYLELELTESMVMHNPEEVIKILERLEALGVQLGIDDFGTGYSSLSYLKRFPVNTLKIDRSFVHELGQDGDAAAIACAVINLGHSLGMKVIAEGVETEQQMKFLQEHRCDYMQGFLFSRPLPADGFVALLEQQCQERRPAAASNARKPKATARKS